MNALLNVGLIRANAAGYVKVRDILSQCSIHHVNVHGARVDIAEPEDTLVLHVSNIDADKLYSMSLALDQDCIAVYDLHACSGALIGPNAKDWGKFNPDFFKVL